MASPTTAPNVTITSVFLGKDENGREKLSTVTITRPVDTREPQLPLTTLWPAQAQNCRLTYWKGHLSGIPTVWRDLEIKDKDTLSCYPTFFTSGGPGKGSGPTIDWGPATTTPRAPWATFSPGICPKSFTIASTNFSGETSSAICCQSGFSYQRGTDYTEGCGAVITTSDLFAFTAIPTTSFLGRGDRTGVPTNKTTLTLVPASIVTAFHYPVHIQWQETDTSLLAAANGTSWAFPRTSSASTSTSAAITTPVTATADPPSEGLAPSAKAGIAVGVLLGVLVPISLACVWFWRRRRQRSPQAGPEQVSEVFPKPELPGESAGAAKTRYSEIDGNGVGNLAKYDQHGDNSELPWDTAGPTLPHTIHEIGDGQPGHHAGPGGMGHGQLCFNNNNNSDGDAAIGAQQFNGLDSKHHHRI